MFKKIKESIESGKESITSTVDSIGNTVNSTKESINSKVDSTIDSVNEAKDTISATIETVSEKTGQLISNTISFSIIGAHIGVVIAAIVAPVPTLIGAAMIWLMADYVEGIFNGIDDKKRSKKSARAIEKLKKYGVIPQTAKIKNDFINMTISSETGEITGSILKGKFKKAKIEDLDIYDIQTIMEEVDDKETLDLLEALIAFKKKKNKVKPKIENH